MATTPTCNASSKKLIVTAPSRPLLYSTADSISQCQSFLATSTSEAYGSIKDLTSKHLKHAILLNSR